MPCAEGCAACVEGDVCTECVPGLYLDADTCVPAGSCVDGTFADDGASPPRCTPCSGPLPFCGRCDDAFTCTRCAPGAYRMGHVCVPGCEELGPFFANDSAPDDPRCERCGKACTTCDDALTCTGCIAGYAVELGQCVSACPPGTWLDGEACAPCEPGCEICSDADTCEWCGPGLYLEAGDCREHDGCVGSSLFASDEAEPAVCLLD